jgi:hypothetical protein
MKGIVAMENSVFGARNARFDKKSEKIEIFGLTPFGHGRRAMACHVRFGDRSTRSQDRSRHWARMGRVLVNSFAELVSERSAALASRSHNSHTTKQSSKNPRVYAQQQQ